MTMGLTPQQARCLDAIVAHLDAHGMSPTIEEIRVATGIKSKSTIHRQLRGLRDRSRITWSAGKPRSILVLASAQIVLPIRLRAELARFCEKHHEVPEHVVADALTIHLDQLAGLVDA
jgi:SOS-response transcriptional repressor LexA